MIERRWVSTTLERYCSRDFEDREDFEYGAFVPRRASRRPLKEAPSAVWEDYHLAWHAYGTEGSRNESRHIDIDAL